ncbi:zinc-finger domain-containing protein [Bacillus massilinigeriensis]|uniref:zinc-finger domain-containing protein n=1 Tax=Bacillus massilionigeriensis TaxID=1805475 RepID=UPI00096B0E6B|nr:zinc-finger domain-containing protein [Bacillus massilionigeriensis]
MDRKKLLEEMDHIMTYFCESCFIHKYHRVENGRRYAHRFCITQCTIGEKLKCYGQRLS